MRKFKKIAALAMACTVCLTVNVTAASYADKPVSALTVIADIKEVVLEKEVISPGESTQMTVEWGVGATLAAHFYSSDTNIVQIENQTWEGCTLTGVGEGTAVITVSNDIYSETVEVTVKDESDRFTYEIEDGSIVFSNYAGNAMMSYVISSNIGYDYDMICEETEAIFTPNENGEYVVTVEEYCEEIFDYSIMDGHFHYFYPVLTNYTVNVTDDEITVNREGSCSYYSEEQVEAQKNLILDIAIDVNGNVPAPDFTVYAKGTENDMYALNGAYFSFLNGVIPDYDDNGRYKTYITTIHNEYKTESYFCLNAPNLYEDPIVQVSDNELAEVMEKTYTSSYMDGDLQIATPDEMKFYRVKALKDSDVTVTAYFDDVKEYDLEIKDGVFKRVNKSEEITDLEYYIQSPSTIIKAKAPVMIKGNQALIRFGLVNRVSDGDVVLTDDMKWEVTGTADSKFKYGKFEKFYDSYGDEAWCLVTAGSPGTVNIKGIDIDFYNNSTQSIYFNLTVNEDGNFDDDYTTEKPVESTLKGDANGDGIFSVSDVVMLQGSILGRKKMTENQLRCADMNKDGAINVIDVVLMKMELQKLKNNEEKVGLIVETTYGGYGVLGQPLGSGEFTQFFDVAEGDILYEDEWGYWYLNIGDSLTNEKQICKIISVDPKSITVSMEGFYIDENEYIAEETEITLAYGDLVNVFSKFPVVDGINYEHQITFTPIDY